jgi:hypothetical protein
MQRLPDTESLHCLCGAMQDLCCCMYEQGRWRGTEMLAINMSLKSLSEV